MIIAVATVTVQNSAYSHRKYEGRFRKRRRPSLLQFHSEEPAKSKIILGHRRLKLRFLLQQGKHFFHQCVGGDAVFFAQDWNGTVLDKLIGPAYAHHRRIDHLRVQMFHDRAAKAVVQNVIFDRADDFDAAREKFERAGIHWFDPAWIDERDRD